MNTAKRWRMVVLFAVAMAWLESAIVFYGRSLVGRLEPYQPNPLPFIAELGPTELVREAATMVMLWAVGWFAGETRRGRWAFACLAFGVWDIFYYVFLRIICGWPRTLLDWDVLFLIPLPWWGPVIAPTLIAALMIAWGTLVALNDTPARPLRSNWLVWSVATIGAVLALAAFMADALRVAGGGVEALSNVLPVKFNWPVFAAALVFLAAPLADVARQLRRRAGEGKPTIITGSTCERSSRMITQLRNSVIIYFNRFVAPIRAYKLVERPECGRGLSAPTERNVTCGGSRGAEAPPTFRGDTSDQFVAPVKRTRGFLHEPFFS